MFFFIIPKSVHQFSNRRGVIHLTFRPDNLLLNQAKAVRKVLFVENKNARALLTNLDLRIIKNQIETCTTTSKTKKKVVPLQKK